MSFGCQKPLETRNFWNFSVTFIALIFFKKTTFFHPASDSKFLTAIFSLPYFLLVFNFEKLFFSPIFQLQFFLRMHIFFTHFFTWNFLSQISITIFQFFLHCAFCFLAIFQIEFFTTVAVRERRARWSPRAPGFWGPPHSSEKIINVIFLQLLVLVHT